MAAWVNWANRPARLYRCYDLADNLLYIGIASEIFGRLATHRHSPWNLQVTKILVENFKTKRAAKVAEAKAIVNENPRYNKAVHSNLLYKGEGPGRKPVPSKLTGDNREKFHATVLDRLNDGKFDAMPPQVLDLVEAYLDNPSNLHRIRLQMSLLEHRGPIRSF